MWAVPHCHCPRPRGTGHSGQCLWTGAQSFLGGLHRLPKGRSKHQWINGKAFWGRPARSLGSDPHCSAHPLPRALLQESRKQALGEPHTAKRFHSCPHKHRPLVIKCCSKEAKAWTESLLRVSWRGDAWDLGQQGSPKTCQGARPWRKKRELENSPMHSVFYCSFHESYLFYITEAIFVRTSK